MLTHFSVWIFYYAPEKWRYAKQSLQSLTREIVPEEKEMKEMPHRPNEIAVKWIESKYARKTYRVIQVKHSLGGLSRLQWGQN